MFRVFCLAGTGKGGPAPAVMEAEAEAGVVSPGAGTLGDDPGGEDGEEGGLQTRASRLYGW